MTIPYLNDDNYFVEEMNKLHKYRQPCHDCDRNAGKTTSTADIDDMIMWEYECHQCKSRFKVPVPRGPTEEKQMKCIICKSMNITREKLDNMEVAFCGG